jgi:hypothetical protein
MRWLIVPGIAALYGLHRLFLWMETKGWLYYAHKKASPNALGNAALAVQQIVQPEAEHVLEVRQSKRAEHDDAGGPDKSGRDARKTTGE